MKSQLYNATESYKKASGKKPVSSLRFLSKLNWIDGKRLVLEPYRQRNFTAFLDTYDDEGFPVYNLGLFGRGKKNWKTGDSDLAALDCLCVMESPGGNQVYTLCSDEGQAADNL